VQTAPPRWRLRSNGVNDAAVSFMEQKLTVDADDSRFDEIMQEIVRVCKRVEPDCAIKL